MARTQWVEWLTEEGLAKVSELRKESRRDKDLAEKMGVTLSALNSARKKYPELDRAVIGEMSEKRDPWKPRRWASGDEFVECAAAYLEKCKEEGRFANVAGFCVFAETTRDTFYAQKEHYPFAYKKVNEMLEEAALQSAITGYPPSVLIFYLKNKCGYKDRQEIDSNINAQVGLSEEDRALLKRVNDRAKRNNPSDKA